MLLSLSLLLVMLLLWPPFLPVERVLLGACKVAALAVSSESFTKMLLAAAPKYFLPLSPESCDHVNTNDSE